MEHEDIDSDGLPNAYDPNPYTFFGYMGITAALVGGNLGAAFANVLIGIEDKSKSKNALEKHLKSLDYSFVEETDNTAYKEFLR